MISKQSVLAIAFLSLVMQAESRADLYLNGGIASKFNSTTGEVIDPVFFEYDSFDTSNSPLFFNGVDETSFLLTPGVNTFTVTGNDAFGFACGLSLFFTPTFTQLTGASDSGKSPDLNVFLPSSGGFAFPTIGTEVATLGYLTPSAAYNGNTIFTIGMESVTVTAWDGTNLQLNVSAVPEPSSFALLAIGSVVCFVRRRKSLRRLVN